MRHDTLPRPAPPAAPAPTGAAQPSKHLTLLLLALTGLMLILDLTITNVALPSIQRALRMTPQGLQWVVNAYALGYGGFLLLGGRLAARGLQGLGAALAGPASLAIITTAFAEGPERNRALGVWSAVLASGGAIGMLAGGLLTQYASWRWVLFVNVPVGALLVIESRHRAPLVPLRILRRRSLTGADTVALLGGAAVIASPIFFLTLYLQQILGFSAIQAGLATLPLGLAVIVTSQLSPRIMERVGRKRLLVSGLALAAVGLALLGRIHPAGSYTVEVLGPVVLLGLGMGLSFVPLTASAVAGVPAAALALLIRPPRPAPRSRSRHRSRR